MNSKIATIFREMAMLLEMKGVQFKPRTFDKAASLIESLGDDVEDLYKKGGQKALLEIPGVGVGMADRIEEYIKTSKIKDYLALKKQIPVNLEDLSAIEGIGPKLILKLYKRLHIKDREQLETALRSGKLRDLKGFGEKSEQNILKNIDFLKKSAGRLPIYKILPQARAMLEQIRKLPSVKQAELAGSLRRMQETIGDVDILITSTRPEEVMDFFVAMSQVASVHAKGPTKSSVRLTAGLDADLRVVPPESFGAALQYFTGDKFHNVALRQLAIKQGYKLNEYGLYRGKKLVTGKTEEEIYNKLGLDYIEPELRTNHDEIELALRQAQGKPSKLPKLIGYTDIKGDLQVHTDWTDGKYSIKKMAEMAQKFGHEYICFSDHTKSLAMTGGLDEKKLLEQMAEIDKVQKELPGIKILKGAEVNIRKDGTLDIEDKVLAKLDVCGAAIHSHFNLSEAEMTARMIRAIENPEVDIIYHPTGRIINRREAYKINIDAVIAAAKRTETILEIDGSPERLDLKDEHIRKALAAGVKIVIDTDAHSYDHYQFIEYGIAQARRAGATKEDVVNTRRWPNLLKLLKQK